MDIGKVVGVVVSTAKEPALDGFKLLLVRRIDALRPDEDTGERPYVAVDTVGAGENEIVLVARGSGARQAERTSHTPVDRAIVAIVDSLTTEGTHTYVKGGVSNGNRGR
jgi:ethanolamine utilization protein EutN